MLPIGSMSFVICPIWVMARLCRFIAGGSYNNCQLTTRTQTQATGDDGMEAVETETK